MCDHESFAANVHIDRIARDETDDVFAFAATITVTCEGCGEPFGFRCDDVGLQPDRPTVDVSARELRVPLIRPAELGARGPLAALTADESYPGFQVRAR